MNLIQALAASTRIFRGEGVNHEGEKFAGELLIEALVGSSALLLRYRAILEDGSLAHEECTLMATGPDGRLTLWPVMSELPVVLSHVEVEARDSQSTAGTLRSVFASGVRDDANGFREEITIELSPGGEVTYAHAWGMPGGPFEDRSSCCMAQSEA